MGTCFGSKATMSAISRNLARFREVLGGTVFLKTSIHQQRLLSYIKRLEVHVLTRVVDRWLDLCDVQWRSYQYGTAHSAVPSRDGHDYRTLLYMVRRRHRCAVLRPKERMEHSATFRCTYALWDEHDLHCAGRLDWLCCAGLGWQVA